MEQLKMLTDLLKTDEGKELVKAIMNEDDDTDKDTVVAEVSEEPESTVEYVQLEVPSKIHVEEYLVDFIKEEKAPREITTEYLIDLGVRALKAKVAYVELFNMTVRGSQGRLSFPHKLTFEDVAVLMMSLFTFKNIMLTSDEEDSMLGMYEVSNSRGAKGTYVTSRHRMVEVIGNIAPGFRRIDELETLNKIKRDIDTVELTQDYHLFAVNNGIFNQRTKKLMEFDPGYIFLTKIPVNYVVNPENPVITASDGYKWDVESWLSDLFDDDEETTELMWQVIADSLQPNVSRHKSIWFYSEKGNNGKGTVGQLIKNLLGEGNYSSLSVEDFAHEFMKSQLIGVSANIADENDVDVYIDSIRDFKAAVTGDDININRKYEDPISFQFKGTNIQMMNGLPKTQDRTDSMYRRILPVPFMKSFTNNGERRYIKDDYISRIEVLEYVLYKALHIEFEEFIVPEASAVILGDYREMNDPVLEYWLEHRERFVWDLIPNRFLYDTFRAWFEMNNPSGRVMGNRTFLDRLRSVIDLHETEWEDRTKRDDARVRSLPRMEADEPMITEYGLDRVGRDGRPTPWMSEDYMGDDPEMRRDFKRASFSRGLVKI